ncbi:MAG: hypothetical protein Q7K42_06640, partial [Candidatus Diapherotrites archaeon]|nr:hypothetical protein [Candidatus Diapherotrites archaeon]
MFRRLFFVLLAFSLLVSGFFAQSELSGVFSEINSTAQSYESGQLNYLQLQVYLNSFREQIYEQFFNKPKDDFSEKVSEDIASNREKLFGLFGEAEQAFLTQDFEKLELVLDKIEAEFKAQ